MKAWLVKEKDEFCATVVFAETIDRLIPIEVTAGKGGGYQRMKFD